MTEGERSIVVSGAFYRGLDTVLGIIYKPGGVHPRAREPESPRAREPESPRAREPESPRAREPESLTAWCVVFVLGTILSMGTIIVDGRDMSRDV
jgi:hypothetical protein